MLYRIYIHTSISGNSYIGFTSRLIEDRLKEHIIDSNKGSNYLFHKSIRKYGITNIKTQFLDETSSQYYAKKLEKFYIRLYDTYHNGYNMTLGGTGGDTLSNHPDKILIGQKISNSLKNIPEERKRKINLSKARHGEDNGMFGSRRTGKDNPMFGKNHTNETKQLLSYIALKRYSNPNWISPIKGIPKTKNQKNAISKANQKTYKFIYNNEIITVTNLTKFCKDNELSFGCMSHVNMGRNKSHKGYSKHNG